MKEKSSATLSEPRKRNFWQMHSLIAVFLVIYSMGGSSYSVAQTLMLHEYWNASRKDNFSVASREGINDAKTTQYEFLRSFAWVFNPDSAVNPPNTVPLKLYWSSQR